MKAKLPTPTAPSSPALLPSLPLSMVSLALQTQFVMSSMYNSNPSFLLQWSHSPDRCQSAPGHCRQRGFSLVELMVGLTIGLLVVLAAIGSLVFTNTVSTVVQDGSRLQQKADAVFRNMGYHISQAGTSELVAAPALASSAPELAKVIFSSAYSGFNTSPAGVIYNIHGLEGASSAPDTLRVSYEANGASRDCLGNPPSTANVDNAFYVDVASRELRCQGATIAGAQAIADGVEDFQVMYGVRTGNIPTLEQYRYYDAGTVPDWTTIQSVRICLLIAGDNKGNPQPNLVFKGCRNETITNDGLLRRVFWRTFSLRNGLL